jgi:hypothetical protein
MAQPSSACLAVLDAVSIALETSTLSLSDYVVTLLKYQALRDHPSTVDLVNNTTKIMTAFLDHLDSKISAFDWASTIMRKKYSVGIKLLVSCEEWHFNTSHASAKELEDFWIEDMAITMKRLAPDLWLLLDMLLMGDGKCPAESLTIDLDEDYVIMSLYSLCGLPKVAPPPWWLIVYTCKVPAVVEGFKKIRVAFFKIKDWINDCICNLNIIFYKSNISYVACFFLKPQNNSWVGG